MNKTQSNYFNMAKAVCDVFDSSRQAWEGKVLIPAAYERLKMLCSSVGTTAAKQHENAPEGHTAAKEEARTVLEDLLFGVGRRLRAYARLEQDAVAEQQSSFSRSSLDLLSLNNLLNHARAIAEVCRVRVEQLRPYEVDEAVLTNLQAAIDKLTTLAAHRDAMMGFRMENTSSIISLLSQTRQELKTLDALVEGFVDDEAFLTVYFNARRLHDVRGGSKKGEE
ncbi:MAG: hypothetical protein LBU92_02220 [Prevotellaceae bacterium]|jgi:hypothetical protein|nr:hypothetical protein [Prevotellaceae bacterium]